MCRALKVLCAAPDRERLAELKRAAVSADWELTPGATDETTALEQLESEHPHVVVVTGGLEGFVRRARDRHPFLRIVTDYEVAGATAVVAGLDEVRAAVKGLPRPAGPLT
jgi:hypothetical protein